ncbi:MAG: Fur family transcriptional regulator [Pirellulales bacterium]
MSKSKPTPPETLRERLKSAGLRCTTARLSVLQHLVDHRGPKTHAEVADELADKGFDRATIYRNLIELTEASMLVRVDVGDHVWRFEFRGDDATHGHDASHPHFVCTSCGEVSCLNDVTVEIMPKLHAPSSVAVPTAAKKRGGPATLSDDHAGRMSVAEIPRVTEVLLKGRCGNCVET